QRGGEAALLHESGHAGHAASVGDDLRSGPRRRLRPAAAGHGHAGAENEVGHRLALADGNDGDAAADADAARRRGDDDGLLLAELAADQAEDSTAGADGEITAVGAGVEDEAVDRDPRVGFDRERATLEE